MDNRKYGTSPYKRYASFVTFCRSFFFPRHNLNAQTLLPSWSRGSVLGCMALPGLPSIFHRFPVLIGQISTFSLISHGKINIVIWSLFAVCWEFTFYQCRARELLNDLPRGQEMWFPCGWRFFDWMNVSLNTSHVNLPWANLPARFNKHFLWRKIHFLFNKNKMSRSSQGAEESNSLAMGQPLFWHCIC